MTPRKQRWRICLLQRVRNARSVRTSAEVGTKAHFSQTLRREKWGTTFYAFLVFFLVVVDGV